MSDKENMLHPTEGLSGEEREYARKMMQEILAVLRQGECMVEPFFMDRGVPPETFRRGLIHAFKHLAAMNAAHHLAIAEVDDAKAEELAAALSEDMETLILKQLPRSRKSLEKAKQ